MLFHGKPGRELLIFVTCLLMVVTAGFPRQLLSSQFQNYFIATSFGDEDVL